jgi:molecular chaperone HtpG
LLQQDRLVSQIRKNIVSKILSSLKDWLHKDRTEYEKFWLEFGTTLKEGIPTDAGNKEKVQDLLLFKSTQSEAWTTLDEYFLRMKPEQKEIYYITGEKLEQVQNSPYLEKLKQKGFEVLLLTEAIDEWVTQGVTEYKTKKLVSITQEGLDLDTEEEKKQKEEIKKAQLERFNSVLEKMKLSLSEQVKDVVVSDRLTETPVCLVSAQNEMSANMQKILSKMEGQSNFAGKRILEVNLNHGIFEQMMNLTDEQISTWSEILYNQALLAEGSALPNPTRYSKLIADLMLKRL